MTVPTLTAAQVRWLRLKGSGLLNAFDSATEAAGALGGIQAQILPAAGLSLFNRTTVLERYTQLDAALHSDRTLLKLWTQRGTLHLIPSKEWPLFHYAIHQGPSWRVRRMQRRGEDLGTFHETLDKVATLLQERNVMTRSMLRDSDIQLSEGLLSSWGGIFNELVLRGVACHAGQEKGQARFAQREHWLPQLFWVAYEEHEANVELCARFFRSYGPASFQDFAYWRGVSQSKAKPWFAALAPTLKECQSRGETLWLHEDVLSSLATLEIDEATWPTHMLYRFDPLLLAHQNKSWWVEDEHYSQVWRKAGHIEGVLLQQGRIKATWRYQRDNKGLSIAVWPFRQLSDDVRSFVEQQSANIAAFFGSALQEVKIHQPLHL